MEDSTTHLPLAGTSILLVEDELIVAQSIVDCLRDAGAQVLIANKASDAFQLIEQVAFAAGVLDVASAIATALSSVNA